MNGFLVGRNPASTGLPSIGEQAMELCIVLAIAALASAGLVSGMRLRVPSGDCRMPANAR
jgi:hypothetical protein